MDVVHPVTDFIVRSKVNCEIPKCTIQEYVWKNVEKWSKKTAVVCAQTGRNYNFQELRQRSLMVANFLTNKFEKYQCICLALENVPEYPILVLGVLQAGMTVTACNSNSTKEEFKFQLRHSAAKLVFTSPEALTRLNQAIENEPTPPELISIDKDGNFDVSMYPEEIRKLPIVVSHTDVALILYSSGTTGSPKGVEFTHHNVVSVVHGILCSPKFNIRQETTDDVQDVVPGFLPFCHTFGMMSCLSSVAAGSKVVTIPKFTSQIFIDVLRKHKPTLLFCVPNVLHMIIQNPLITTEDLSRLRYVTCGAAPLSAADVERFKFKVDNEAVVIRQGYGLTECSGVVLTQTDRIENGLKIGGVGFLIGNMQAKIIQINDDDKDKSLVGLGSCQMGELMLRGPTIMKGYHNDAKATAEALTEDGWLRTGDVGYYDEHEHFFIVDRIKDIIKVKGFQVSPSELEAILRAHPKIDDAGVVGVPHPLHGEAPRAFVVARQGTTSAELLEFVSTRVSSHKRLEGGIEFVAALPKNAVGKIQRKELRKMALN